MKPYHRSLAALPILVLLVLVMAGTHIASTTRAAPAYLYVSTVPNCGGNSPCYSSVQDALDAANPGNQIYVAAGTYTDTAGTVADIDETVTLLGGWNASFTLPRDPDTYITTLDAQRGGHVVEIIGVISPTVDGFVITGGDATGESVGYREGGGICSRSASPIIINNVITNNIACSSGVLLGKGGGIFLLGASTSALISGNEILSNTASTSSYGYGGGIYIQNCDPTVTGNTVQENVGSSSTSYDGKGGGLYLNQSAATVSGNTIIHNTASTVSGGEGGGVMVAYSNATLDANRIISNTAPNQGGGVSVDRSDGFTLTNNIIAQNRADSVGGGIYAWGTIVDPASGALVNNTIADNDLGAAGEGVWAQNATTLTLTNNIVYGHTYGIYAAGSDATITADYTVFHGNTSADTGGSGTIVSTNALNKDPLFVNPSSWDYRISSSSPAVNTGTFDGAPAKDFQGDARPYDCFIDIGADENTASDECVSVRLPLVLKRD